jgi:basic membrane lipoprotein Med (substrate-binding protein (PBP1-ABC) superfamily)
MAARARWVVWSALVLLAAACTGGGAPEPAPTPAPTPTVSVTPGAAEPEGLRVVVVLPLADERPAGPVEIRAAVGDLRVATRDDIAELRVMQPDGPAFVADLVALAAAEGYDLVCAVGAGARAAVVEVAADHPEVRFCALPGGASEGAPGNVHLLELAREEAAYLAGAAVAARIAPPPQLEEGEPQPVPLGLVAPSGAVWSSAERAAFELGVRRRIDRPLELRVATAAPDDLATRGTELLEGGVSVVVGAAGVPLAALQEAAASGGGLAVATIDGRATIDGPTTAVLAIVRLDIGVALETAVRALVDGEAPEPAVLGVAEGAISVAAGGAPRAEEALHEARAAADDLAEGRVTVR